MPIAPPTVPPAGVTDSRYARRRILAYGDSLTAGYYNQGAAFSPYADALRSDLCAFARDASSAGAGADEHSAVAIDVCGASGLTALQLLQGIDSKTLYDVCDREYSGLRYLLKKKAQQQRRDGAEVGVMYDAALIMLGTNDLAQKGVTAQEIAAAITQLHTVCHSFGIQTVALPILPNYFSCTTSRDDLVAYQTTRRQVNRLLEEWTGTQGGQSLFVDVTGSLPPWSEDGKCWENDGLHLSPAGSRCLGELLGAHEPTVRFLLGDAYLEPVVESRPRMDSSGRVAVPPADEVLAADVAEVAYQAGVSEGVARDALARNEYEIVAAVLDLARCAGN